MGGTPLQYSCLENPMDGGAWWAADHGVARSRTRLSDFTLTFHFHALEKERATHSIVLAWRIPGMAESGGLPSMGSHRVGHDWSDLAAAAAAKRFLFLAPGDLGCALAWVCGWERCFLLRWDSLAVQNSRDLSCRSLCQRVGAEMISYYPSPPSFEPRLSAIQPSKGNVKSLATSHLSPLMSSGDDHSPHWLPLVSQSLLIWIL